jgi:hypothetical protein
MKASRMTNPITDRAPGILRGAVDAAQGVMHEVRAGHSDSQPADRAAAAHARWLAGQPARNTFERDAYAAAEANLSAGMNHLNWLGKQASEMEADRAAAVRQAERGDPEAGS